MNTYRALVGKDILFKPVIPRKRTSIFVKPIPVAFKVAAKGSCYPCISIKIPNSESGVKIFIYGNIDNIYLIKSGVFIKGEIRPKQTRREDKVYTNFHILVHEVKPLPDKTPIVSFKKNISHESTKNTRYPLSQGGYLVIEKIKKAV